MIAVAIDIILGLVLVEGAVLTLFYHRSGKGLPPRDLWPNLAAGFLLMLAVRVALSAAAPSRGLQAAIAAVLACAFIAHAIDLAARWRA